MKRMVAVVLLVPGIAAADPEHFVTIDRQDDSSRAGAELSYVFLPKNENGTLMRFDVHGQYVDPVSGVGGYVSVPFGYLSSGNMSDEALADIEAGAIYAVRLANPDTKLILHAGLTLPTEKSSVTSAEIGVISSMARLADFYQSVPEGTSLRLGVSPMVRSGQLFARADLGLDVNLSDSDSNNTASKVVRLQAGAGIDFGQAAVMIENTNLLVTGSGNDKSVWVDTGALSVRVDTGGVYPYAAFVIALEDESKQLMDDALTVGIEGKLR